MMNLSLSREFRISPVVRLQLVAAFAFFIAGIIHLDIVPYHLNHAPAHGIFMLVSGVVELIWVALFLRRSELKISAAGIIIAISLVLLWVISRVFPAPFGDGGPEEIDAAGILSKSVELVGAGALMMLAFQYYLNDLRRARAWQILAALMIAGLALGGLGYGVSRASEPLFPDLVQSEYLPHYHSRAPWDTWKRTELVSQEVLTERTGIRVKQLSVSIMGGVIDFRFDVVDPVKANVIMDDHESMPRLVIENRNIEVEIAHGMKHILEERPYYMFFPNPDHLIQTGDTVTLVIGDSRSNTFVVK